MRNPKIWILTGSDTNQAVQLLEVEGKEEEVLFYPSSENKDADQLRGYREADLHLCFRMIMQIVGFLTPGLIYIVDMYSSKNFSSF